MSTERTEHCKVAVPTDDLEVLLRCLVHHRIRRVITVQQPDPLSITTDVDVVYLAGLIHTCSVLNTTLDLHDVLDRCRRPLHDAMAAKRLASSEVFKP